MTEPKVGPDVPGSDSPSPDVLDELLRAFSVDPDAAERHRDIDLTSPEVAELLTPSGGAPVEDALTDDADEVTVDDDPSVEPSADDAHFGAPLVDEAAFADESTTVVAPMTSDGDDVDPSGDIDPSLEDAVGVIPGVVGDPFLAPVAPPADDAPADDGRPGTITIVDEGLPDTVYIGGNLEVTDVSRSTVVIGDRDGDSSMLSLEDAATATKIEPRMRERRMAVKKAQGRKRLKWALVAVVVVALVVGALAVLGSGLFAIDEVQVEGAEQTTEAELAPLVAELEGKPVLTVDTEAIESQLEELPWVEAARVTTRFPDGATIELRERIPRATFQTADGAWRLVDDSGRVLSIAPEAFPGYLHVLGEGFPDVAPGEYAPTGLREAAVLARSLTATMVARAQDIRVTLDGADLRMTFTDGTEVRFGPAEDLVAKLVRLETKLDELGDGRVTYLDVSTNEVGQG